MLLIVHRYEAENLKGAKSGDIAAHLLNVIFQSINSATFHLKENRTHVYREEDLHSVGKQHSVRIVEILNARKCPAFRNNQLVCRFVRKVIWTYITAGLHSRPGCYYLLDSFRWQIFLRFSVPQAPVFSVISNHEARKTHIRKIDWTSETWIIKSVVHMRLWIWNAPSLSCGGSKYAFDILYGSM